MAGWPEFFVHEETALDVQTAGKSTWRGSGHYPVTRDKQRHGIFTAGVTDSPESFRHAACPGYIAISDGAAKGDISDGPPHFLLERSAAGEKKTVEPGKRSAGKTSFHHGKKALTPLCIRGKDPGMPGKQ